MSSPTDRHRRLLERWRAAHPGSPHPGHDLERLEALKLENDRKVERDLRLRPEVCESSPSYMTIGNTHKCNLTCNMCFKQLDAIENMSLPDLGLSTFEAVAHEFFPHMRTVALSVSGDPLLSKTLFDELDLLATYGVRAFVTTNGMPLSRKGLYERLLPALHTLVLSMDGASQPVFDSIRRGALLPKVLENIRAFDEARNALPDDTVRPALHFNTILQRKNVEELPALVELAHRLNVDHVAVDHVVIHPGLNDDDALDPYKALTNDVFERTRELAERLGLSLRLPDPFALAPDHRDAELVPDTEEELLAHAHEKLETVRFDPALFERWWEEPDYVALTELSERGGTNVDLVEMLLERGMLEGHLLWGVPQAGPALTPPSRRKVSGCTYAWRETYIEWNGVVSPCCNPAMGVGRVMGRFDPERPFAEIWNGETYRNLRRSLTSGDNYRFCRTCYLFEHPDEADWGTTETWTKVAAEVSGETAPISGAIPDGKRAFLFELRSGPVPAGSTLEVFADERLLVRLDARAENGTHSFARKLDQPLPVESGQFVRARLSGVDRAQIDFVAYLE